MKSNSDATYAYFENDMTLVNLTMSNNIEYEEIKMGDRENVNTCYNEKKIKLKF